MKSFLVGLFWLCFAVVSNAADPPTTWKEHCFEHVQNLSRVYFNSDVAIYFDDNMNRSVTWPNTYLTKAWQYTKRIYGDFGSDNRLYAIFHSNRYGGGHPHSRFDPAGDNRNVIDCGADFVNAWAYETDNDWNVVTHEISHIVEFSAYGIQGSPARALWGDSKFAEIYNYDVYLGLGYTNMAQRWYNLLINGTDSYPCPGTQWFKNWFYPIYTMNGANTGTATLVKFFQLLSQLFPKSGQSYARDLNMGEFVHFWSGAVGKNLKDQAKKAFCWSTTFEAQLNQAIKDFPTMPYGDILNPLYKATLFENVNHQGPQIDLSASDTNCRDLPANFSQKASSVHGRDGCILVFSDKGCGGQRRIIKSGCSEAECCSSHFDFGSCGFDNKATSYAFCNAAATPTPPPTYRATLFENINHQGAQIDLTGSDTNCHDLPSSFLQKASSVHGRDGCILVFSEKNCAGQRRVIKSGCNGSECCSSHFDFGSCSFDNKAASYAFCYGGNM